MYTDFFALTLVDYFHLNNFLYKSPPTKTTFFAFWRRCGLGPLALTSHLSPP